MTTWHPDSWTVVQLRHIADIQLGKMLDRGRPKGRPRRYLRNVNVRWDSIDTSDLLTMSLEDDELDRYGIRQGDLLVCEGGEPGRSAVWSRGDTDLSYQKALHRVRPSDGVAGRWVMYHLMRDAQTGRLSRSFTGSTIAHLPLERLREYEILVAPAPEQQRIVETLDACLSRLASAVASLERARTKLKAYRASVLKAAVEGRLAPTEAELARKEGRSYEPADVLLAGILDERRRRWEDAELAKMRAAGKTPKDDKWKTRYNEPPAPDTSMLPNLSEGWCWATVEQLGEVTGGLTKNAAKDRGAKRHPYLRVANVYSNRLVLDEIKEIGVDDRELPRLLLRRGDLLVVEGNGSVDQIGRVALWDGSIQGVVHQNHLIKVRLTSTPLERWLLAWLLSTGGRRVIESVASSTSGLHTLSISKVQRLLVPLPPVDEQVRLLETVDQLLSIVDANFTGIAAGLCRCDRLRQAILKWAFEGKLVDQDPTDEPADVLLARIRAERAAAVPVKPKPKQQRARNLKVAS